MRSLAALASLVGCTTLGPMPAMTGTTPLPPERTSIELQGALVPGYFLSTAAKEEPDGAGIGQVAAVVELGRLLGAPGITLGGRYVGKPSEGGYGEPFAGYRVFLDPARRVAMAVLVFGTRADGAHDDASFKATRAGGEAAFDVRVTPEHEWLELHLVGTVGATALWAEGRYCLDDEGRFGVDCGDPPFDRTDVEGSGVYPSGSAGIAIDIARHRDHYFHGARIAVTVGGGAMPRAEAGEQTSAAGYASAGLSITVGFGAAAR